ncbi:MAG: glutathione S-transferase family protein [Myxococcales bacterium]|nr:glutathione S-transferase family protein [Myxococcales bacterium]
MALTLYGLPGSPYAWRVQLLLEHKGLDYELHKVDFGGGELRSDAYRAINPRGKVPVLKDGDFTLYESLAILEYLEDRYADSTRLYPGDPQKRAVARRVICEIDNYWLPPMTQIFENVYFKPNEADWDEQAMTEGRAGLSKELAHFESLVQGDSFVSGEFGAAELCLYPMLAHLPRYERRRESLALTREVGPGLRALMKRVESQPYFDKTFPAHWR